MRAISIPYHEDLLAALADTILQHHQQTLPDLNSLVVLIPDYLPSKRLTQLLLRGANRNALLGPQIFTLRDFVEKNTFVDLNTLSGDKALLQLIEALKEQHASFFRGNPWTVANLLLRVFDELTRYQVALPQDLPSFIALLENVYQCKADEISALSIEAKMLHQLWHAWQAQLASAGVVDRNTSYIAKLNAIEKLVIKPQAIYVAGYCDLLPAEKTWLNTVQQQCALTVMTHGRAHGDKTYPEYALHKFNASLQIKTQNDIGEANAYSAFLNGVFHHGDNFIGTRAKQFATRVAQSPMTERLRLCQMDNFEQEACAIDLQIRQWWLQGKRDIALVIEDRKLARRVRALLERSNLALRDTSGWALSTTSAAAALENWLSAIEQDFFHQPLLDALRSPYVWPEQDRDDFLYTLYRFEHDVVRHENVARNLRRYRDATERRLARLQLNNANIAQQLDTLFTRIDAAAYPLQALRSNSSTPASVLVQALTQSMKLLEMEKAFATDGAGRAILDAIYSMQLSAQELDYPMSWHDFRVWLNEVLEQNNFRPDTPQHNAIELLSLERTDLSHYQALIIANASVENFPGTGTSIPFFNNQVRKEFGLPTQQDKQAIRFYRFRKVLEAAENICITWHASEDAGQCSPWIELIETFHSLAYGQSLRDTKFEQLLKTQNTLITTPQQVPAKVQTRPAPSVPASLLPTSVSASAHQKLIDCPYAFFAAACLRLQAPQEVSDVLSKSEFGSKVHQCLEAFHQKIPGLPGPFRKPLTETSREEAIALLQQISIAVFAKDVEDNFQHRGWLVRWEQLVPNYIDWQIERAKTWQVDKLELQTAHAFAPDKTCAGRIDRMDKHGDEYAIVDYKTGTVPSQSEVEHGEYVQLPHYAFSANGNVTRFEYLVLNDGEVKSKCTFELEQAATLTADVISRLGSIEAAIANGASLPAWGDEKSCEYCQFKGLCRKPHWAADP